MEELRGAGLNKLTRVWVVVRTHPPTRTPFPPFPPFPPRVPASVQEQHVSAPPCTSRTSSWWQRCSGSPGGFLFYSNLIECGAGREAAAAAPLAGKPAPRCAFRHTQHRVFHGALSSGGRISKADFCYLSLVKASDGRGLSPSRPPSTAAVQQRNRSICVLCSQRARAVALHQPRHVKPAAADVPVIKNTIC